MHNETSDEFRTILYSIGDAVIVLDVAGRVKRMNSMAEQLTGWTEQESQGKLCLDVLHLVNEETRMEVASPAEYVLREGQITALANHTLLIARDGTERPITDSGAPIRDQDGVVSGVVLVFRDQTAERAAERALYENERSLSTLMSNLPGMVFRCRNDRDWTMEFLSEGVLALTGYRAEEFLKEQHGSFSSLIHALDQNRLWECVQLAVAAHQPFEIEYRIYTAEGQIKWVWERGQGVYAADGSLLFLEGFIADITKRKKAEAALSESEQQYRELFESAPVGIFETTSTGRVISFNPTLAQMLGFSSPKEAMQYYTDLGHQIYTQPERRVELIRLLYKHGSVNNFEFEAKTKDGQRIWLTTNTRIAKRNPDGSFNMSGFLIDITERKRADEALQLSEQRYRELFESAPIGIFETMSTGQPIAFNPTAAYMMGFASPEEFIEYCTDIGSQLYVEPEKREELLRLIRKNGFVKNFEFASKTKAGQHIWLSMNARVSRHHPGGTFNLEGFLADITERKRADEALQLSEQRYRELFEGAPIGIFETVSTGSVITFNPTLAHMLGFSKPEEAIQYYTNLGEQLYTQPERRKEFLQQMREEGFVSNFELPAKTKDGRNIWFTMNAKISAHNPDGSFNMVGFLIDITERKHADEALQLSEQRYRELFEGAPIGIFETISTGSVIRFNPALAHMLGFSQPEEAIRYYTDLGRQLYVNPERREEWIRLIREKGSVTNFELEGKTKDGQILWQHMHARISKHNADGSFNIEGFLIDITERKHADEALQLSEQRYRELFEGAPIGIFETISMGSVIRFNPALAHMLGFSQPEDAIQYYTDLGRQLYVNPERREECIRLIREKGSVTNFELEAKTKDGQIIWQHMHARISKHNADGSFNIEGFLIDITERKHTEWALQRSEQRYRELYENAPVAIFETSSEGNCISMNPANAEMLGFGNPDEAILYYNNVSNKFYAHPEQRKGILQTLQKQGYFKNVEIAAKTKDGIEKWFSMDAKIERYNPDGTFIIVGFFIDITERKRADEALKMSERNYREIFNSTHEAISIIDTITGDTIDVNQPMVDMYGFSDKDEIIYGDNSRLCAGDSIYTVEQAHQNNLMIEPGHPMIFEWHAKKKNGELFWVEVSLRRSMIGGQDRVLAVIRDISERKQAEDALQQSERNYREIFDATHEAIFIIDPATGQITDVNQSMVEMYGYSSKDEIVYGDNRRLSSEEGHYIEEEANRNIRIARAGNPRIFEWQARKKTGELFWVEVSLRRSTIGGQERVLAVVRNITERKQAEDALHQSEERWRSYIEHAPYGVFIVDELGHPVQVNATACRMTGYEESELLAQNVAGFLAPDSIEAGRKGYAELLERGALSIELTYKNKQDEMRWWAVAAVRIAENRYLGYANDITDKKQAELALKRSEYLLQRVFDILPVGLWFADKNGMLIRGNPRGVKIWGAEPHVAPSDYGVFKARRLPSREEIAPDDWALARTIREGVSIVEELLEIDTFDGQKRIILNYTAPVLDDDGNMLGAIVVNHDITRRWQAEESLRESELFSKEIQRIARLGGWKANPFTDYLKWTEGVNAILEAPREYAPSLSEGMMYFQPEYLPLFKNNLTHCLETGEPFAIECEVNTMTGRRLWAEVRGLAPVVEGERYSVIGTYQDISERKSAEEEKEKLQVQLLQAQKMESVGRLAGGVAHDFNNMLGVILGNTELALTEMPTTNPIYMDLLEIKKAAQHSTDLTRQLLAFARKQTVSPKVLDLNETVAGMLTMLRRLIGEDIELSLKPGMGLWPVKMDPSQIDQMLANLCINSRDAISGVGMITIETRNATFDEADCEDNTEVRPGEYVMMAVSDTAQAWTTRPLRASLNRSTRQKA